MDIGKSILVHREYERGKSMADNGGPVRVILNRRSLGFTSIYKANLFKLVVPLSRQNQSVSEGLSSL